MKYIVSLICFTLFALRVAIRLTISGTLALRSSLRVWSDRTGRIGCAFMKSKGSPIATGVWVAGGMLCLTTVTAGNFNSTEQTVHLQAGWNAIWLEVEPQQSADGSPKAPREVFTLPSITKLATYSPERGPLEFVDSPTGESFNKEGWSVWYRDDPAKISNLSKVYGNRAYLVFVEGSSGVDQAISGVVTTHMYQWVPDSYNLVGFGLESPGPTFKQFFGPTGKTHPVSSMLKLVNGNWIGVGENEEMKAGLAYWVYSAGPSRYQGPFSIDIRTIDILDFGKSLSPQELLIHNATETPARFRITRVSSNNGLELVELLPNPAEQTVQTGDAIVDYLIPPEKQDALPGGSSVVRTIKAVRNWTTPAQRNQLYKVSSEQTRTYFWLPVSAETLVPEVIQGAPASAGSAGLWVGEVIVSDVSRPLPAESSLAPGIAASGAPKGRVIIHVDPDGKASLLKAVTFLQRRATDPAGRGMVLVLNEAKIPYYEGIEKRGGKLVGRRIETIFYDLPRKVLPIRPLSSAERPAELKEEYQDRLELEGGVGPGAACNAWLDMDEWHHSNPFRHAYHPSHQAGFRIQRQLIFTFDPGGPDPDTLQGVYTEKVRGLTRYSEQIQDGNVVARDGEEIQAQGRFALRRISQISTLE
jgi:hypothetical protein